VWPATSSFMALHGPGLLHDLVTLVRLGVTSRAQLAAENLFLRKQLALYLGRAASASCDAPGNQYRRRTGSPITLPTGGIYAGPIESPDVIFAEHTHSFSASRASSGSRSCPTATAQQIW
jgi:hypothetical protein